MTASDACRFPSRPLAGAGAKYLSNYQEHTNTGRFAAQGGEVNLQALQDASRRTSRSGDARSESGICVRAASGTTTTESEVV